jgi:DNA-binding transcriptional regulator/RsmH inhibitor MraZ
MLSAFGSKIEIWSKEKYKEMIASEPDDISELGEKVMGKLNKGGADSGVS